jgi:hypothetical protein
MKLGRIEKDVIISRSGVYNYGAPEIPSLKNHDGSPMSTMDAPEEIRNRRYFSVYRPALVVADSKDVLTDLTLTVEHPLRGVVDGINYKNEAVGWTGETTEIVKLPNSNEIGVKSSIKLIDNSAIDYYDRGYREVSPGYKAQFRWSIGKSPDGIDYQIIMDSVVSADHCALTQRGRGGPEVAILDSQGGLMVFKTGFFRWLKKTFAPTQDSALEFKEQLKDLVMNRCEWSDAMIGDAISKLRKCTEDLPVSEKKDTLNRLIDDFYAVKNVFTTDEDAMRAAEMVATLYDELDTTAMEEVDMLFGKKKQTTDAEPPEKAAPAKPATEPPAEPQPGEAPKPTATDTPAAPAATDPQAPAPITLESIPDKSVQMSDEQLAFVIDMTVAKLKAEATQSAPAPESPPVPPPAAANPQMQAQDSVFRQSLAANPAGSSILEFVNTNLFPKRGKK